MNTTTRNALGASCALALACSALAGCAKPTAAATPPAQATQQDDGTITVPEVLVPYMGGKTVIGPEEV